MAPVACVKGTFTARIEGGYYQKKYVFDGALTSLVAMVSRMSLLYVLTKYSTELTYYIV